MTQVHNPGYARAFALRELGRRAALSRASDTPAMIKKVKGLAHTLGCAIREPDGRTVPVTPKWFLNVLFEGLQHADFVCRRSTLRGVLRGRHFGALTLTRAQVSWLQSISADAA